MIVKSIKGSSVILLAAALMMARGILGENYVVYGRDGDLNSRSMLDMGSCSQLQDLNKQQAYITPPMPLEGAVPACDRTTGNEMKTVGGEPSQCKYERPTPSYPQNVAFQGSQGGSEGGSCGANQLSCEINQLKHQLKEVENKDSKLRADFNNLETVYNATTKEEEELRSELCDVKRESQTCSNSMEIIREKKTAAEKEGKWHEGFLADRKRELGGEARDALSAMTAESSSGGSGFGGGDICLNSVRKASESRQASESALMSFNSGLQGELNATNKELSQFNAVRKAQEAASAMAAGNMSSADGVCTEETLYITGDGKAPHDAFFSSKWGPHPEAAITAVVGHNGTASTLKYGELPENKHSLDVCGPAGPRSPPQGIPPPPKLRWFETPEEGLVRKAIKTVPIHNAINKLKSIPPCDIGKFNITTGENFVSRYVPGFGPLKLSYNLVEGADTIKYEVVVNGNGASVTEVSENRLADMILGLLLLEKLPRVYEEGSNIREPYILFDSYSQVLYGKDKVWSVENPILSYVTKDNMTLITKHGAFSVSSHEETLASYLSKFFKISGSVLYMNNGWQLNQFADGSGREYYNVEDAEVYFKKENDGYIYMHVSPRQARSKKALPDWDVLQNIYVVQETNTITGILKSNPFSKVILTMPSSQDHKELMDMLKNQPGWPFGKLQKRTM